MSDVKPVKTRGGASVILVASKSDRTISLCDENGADVLASFTADEGMKLYEALADALIASGVDKDWVTYR